MNYRTVPFAIAFGILVLDRISKLIIQTHVSALETLRVIPGFFNIVHAENPGVAFGFLAESESAWRTVFLIGLSASVLIFITTLLWKARGNESWFLRVGLALVLGGAAGNLYDRVLTGTVTDFVEVYAGQHFFPAFNVADSAISIGAALLLLDMWQGRSAKTKLEPHLRGPEQA
jgi:signal peptidase II